MRIPVRLLEEDLEKIEEFLGAKVRIVGDGNRRVIVFRKEQWKALNEAMNKREGSPINEASALVTRAYSRVIAYGPQAKSSPAGRMALIAAIVSLYNADPGLGSNLAYLLD